MRRIGRGDFGLRPEVVYPNSYKFGCERVDQNAASLERLDGVRILANGCRLSERFQQNIKRRYL